jgi:hypothetical protein
MEMGIPRYPHFSDLTHGSILFLKRPWLQASERRERRVNGDPERLTQWEYQGQYDDP